MTTEKTDTVTDPNQMTATQLQAHLDAKETKHRAEMKVLRALLRVREEYSQNWASENFEPGSKK